MIVKHRMLIRCTLNVVQIIRLPQHYVNHEKSAVCNCWIFSDDQLLSVYG